MSNFTVQEIRERAVGLFLSVKNEWPPGTPGEAIYQNFKYGNLCLEDIDRISYQCIFLYLASHKGRNEWPKFPPHSFAAQVIPRIPDDRFRVLVNIVTAGPHASEEIKEAIIQAGDKGKSEMS